MITGSCLIFVSVLQRAAAEVSNKLSSNQYDETTWSARSWMAFASQQLSVAVQLAVADDATRSLIRTTRAAWLATSTTRYTCFVWIVVGCVHDSMTVCTVTHSLTAHSHTGSLTGDTRRHTLACAVWLVRVLLSRVRRVIDRACERSVPT